MGANDLPIGTVKFTPDFDVGDTGDQWVEVQGGSGRIQIAVQFKPSAGHRLTIDDFELITVIGKGSFGKVRRNFAWTRAELTN
jgi:serum/glucocorticoid-regulated kinase 2